MNNPPNRIESNKIRNHKMLCRICENLEVTYKLLGPMFGISENSVLKGVRKQMVDSGAKMINGKAPHKINEIRSCYNEYLKLRG